RDRRCITDDMNECGLPNLPRFREHRHDQSILTNLCVKHKISSLEPLPVPLGVWTKNLNIWSQAIESRQRSIEWALQELNVQRMLSQTGRVLGAQQNCKIQTNCFTVSDEQL